MTDDAPLPTSLPAWIPERKKSRGEPTSSSNGDFIVLKKKFQLLEIFGIFNKIVITPFVTFFLEPNSSNYHTLNCPDPSTNSCATSLIDGSFIGNSLITGGTCRCRDSNNTRRTKAKSDSLPSVTPTILATTVSHTDRQICSPQLLPKSQHHCLDGTCEELQAKYGSWLPPTLNG